MGLEAYRKLSEATAQTKVPNTQESKAGSAVRHATQEVAYENAGQQPPTPAAVAGPAILGESFGIWLLIVVLLFLGFLSFSAYEHVRSHGARPGPSVSAGGE